ncbi:MAG: cardiolipin synthase [Oscillospiraceae bacterium]
MKYRKIIFNRIFITALLLIIQIAWMVFFLFKLTEYSVAISGIFSVLSVCIMLYLVGKDDNPEYRIGWIILIAAVPLFGGLLYIFAGDKKPSKKMHKLISDTQRHYLPELIQESETVRDMETDNPRAASTFNYVQKMGGYPVYRNTDVKYYPLGDDMFPDMLEEIDKAEHYIFMEYFIITEGYMWDTILEKLVEKAKSGVEVRIIYDDMGCVALLPPGYWKQLEALDPNIKCMAFNKVVPFVSLVMNNRDHRKIFVIDGHTAFSGGINISDEYINYSHPYGHWKDTGVRLKGEAVYSFTEMFLEMWNTFRPENDVLNKYMPSIYGEAVQSDGFVQPFSDTPLDNEPLSENVYMDIINQAQKYVYIFTPYLIIDDNMKSVLCLAAKRGVDVRIVTPGVPDKKIIYRLTRANYVPLLNAGVRIFEYEPGFIHAKSYISDDNIGIVGTINMDYRSLYLHFECGTLMYKTEALKDLKEDHIKTMEQSREITLDNYKEYFHGTMFDAILRTIAPLL